MKQNKDIITVLNFFNIDISNTKIINPLGNFSDKIDQLFRGMEDEKIKPQIQGGRFIFDLFSKNFLIGGGQTWAYIHNGLFFFGLVDDKKYSDSKIEKGLTIRELRKFHSLQEYLKSQDCYDNMLRNFEKEPEWFRKIIAGSFLAYAISHGFESKFFTDKSIASFKKKKYSSKYRGLFENLKIILMNNSNALTELDIKKLDRFSDSVRGMDMESINKILKKNTPETKKIGKLRNQFAKSLQLEFNQKMNDIKMIEVISEYAKTFDFDICMTKPDKAHIIPVWYLVKQKRWDDIKNPNNGLILDPNTHRLFDKDPNTTLENSEIKNQYHTFNINPIFLNSERKKFIDEWILKVDIFK